MDFKIKNFGKISEANIKLDGITVICGDNNTGKSTVGKALFSFYYSLHDLKKRITAYKTKQIRDFLFNYAYSRTKRLGYAYRNGDDFTDAILDDEITIDKLKRYVDEHIVFANDAKITKDSLIPLVNALNAPVSEIINELVFRIFDNVLNGQIKNVNNPNGKCSITAVFNNGISDIGGHGKEQNVISFTRSTCNCDKVVSLIQHTAYYINSPFVLDWLNNADRSSIFRVMNPMDRSAVFDIMKAQAEINNDPMSNLFESVLNKADLKRVKEILKSAYRGDTKFSDGKYLYTDENGKNYDFRNISAGLKSFALIERMLETGVLKKKDVLILDEPEIHLHSEWQIIYAELIVILQKTFDLTILLVTHSFQFLESLDFFMKKYEISNNGNYYMPESTEKGVVLKSYGNDALELKRNLATGSAILSDLKFKYEMENYREEDN